jgi:polyisoprenoid-binding protein YceI
VTLPSSSPGVTSAPAIRTFAVDGERSAIRFAVRFLAWRIVRGSFSDVSGRITDCQDPARSGGEIHVAVASLRTGNRLRDRHLRSSHYLDVRRFPTIAFRATGVRVESARTLVTGALTIRDVTQSVELEVTRVRARITSPDRDARLRLRGRIRIDRARFGVRGAGLLRLADWLIGRQVECEVDIEAGPTSF